MGLESGTYIDSLVSTNPLGTDNRSQGDDHIRLLKSTIKASFPDVDEIALTIHNGSSAPSTPQTSANAASRFKKDEPMNYVAQTLADADALLDLTYEEDSAADIDMNVVLTAGGKIVELQATAENSAFSQSDLLKLLALARKGCTKLSTAQAHALNH